MWRRSRWAALGPNSDRNTAHVACEGQSSRVHPGMPPNFVRWHAPLAREGPKFGVEEVAWRSWRSGQRGPLAGAVGPVGVHVVDREERDVGDARRRARARSRRAPPASRSSTASAPAISTPSSRTRSIAVTKRPPEVTTSSTTSARSPGSIAGPSIQRWRPCSLRSLRTKNAFRSSAAAQDRAGDRVGAQRRAPDRDSAQPRAPRPRPARPRPGMPRGRSSARRAST